MRETEFLLDLDPQWQQSALMRVRIKTKHGVVVDFVAQLEVVIAARDFPVVRFDGSHGVGHRDLLDRHGATIQKDWLPEGMTLAQALNYGIDEIKQRWRRYRIEFLTREGFQEG